MTTMIRPILEELIKLSGPIAINLSYLIMIFGPLVILVIMFYENYKERRMKNERTI